MNEHGKLWQETVEDLFGGRDPDPESVPVVGTIEEEFDIEPVCTDKPKRKGIPKSFGDVVHEWAGPGTALGCALAFAIPLGFLFLVMFIFISIWNAIAIETLNRTSCADMLNWTMNRVPARCFAEWSKAR
jgi:hypothetical protein